MLIGTETRSIAHRGTPTRTIPCLSATKTDASPLGRSATRTPAAQPRAYWTYSAMDASPSSSSTIPRRYSSPTTVPHPRYSLLLSSSSAATIRTATVVPGAKSSSHGPGKLFSTDTSSGLPVLLLGRRFALVEDRSRLLLSDCCRTDGEGVQ
eukprot:scaffold7340_cov266-Pinguiococcus_pyrenoidosus.AAC.19